MAYEYDRIEREEGSGAFLMGLLAGTVLGAGLGMLFAPKAGSELRSQLSDQAHKLRDSATDTYNQASEKVTQMVDRGREAYDRARGTASRAADRAAENVARAADNVSRAADSFGATGTAGTPGSRTPGERL